MQAGFGNVTRGRRRDRDGEDLFAILDVSNYVASDAEPCKHASSILLGSSADICDDPELWFGVKCTPTLSEQSARGEFAPVVFDDDLDLVAEARMRQGLPSDDVESSLPQVLNASLVLIAVESFVRIDCYSNHCCGHPVNVSGCHNWSKCSIRQLIDW